MENNTYEKTQFDIIKQQVAGFSISSYAKQAIEKRSPSSSLRVVETWQQETQEAREILSSNQHVPFMGLSKIEDLTKRLEKGIILEPHELIEYADFLRSSRLVKKFFEKNQYITPLLKSYSQSLADFSKLEDEIYSVIHQNRLIDEASRELKKIRKQINETEKEIDIKLKKFMQQAQNKPMIQEFLIVKKDQYFTIPIKASYKNKIAGTIIETSQKGATVFVEPPGIRKLNESLIMHKGAESSEIYQILASLTGLIFENIYDIQLVIEAMTELDIIFARAKYSQSIEGRQPIVNKDEKIRLKNVYHPLLASDAVPLTLELGEYFRGLTITGPNAGGKTVVLKTLGLVTLMAMFGLQIHSDKGTEIAIMDQIFVDIGDEQSLQNSLSTFSAHVKQLALIVNKARRHTLVLLDEIGSGTDPKEGSALANATLGRLYEKGALVVSTTHYGEIKDFSQKHQDFTTAAMAFDAESFEPKYQLLLGETGESNGFWIARKMGLEKTVIQLAKQAMRTQEYPIEKINFEKENKVDKQNEHSDLVQTFSKGDKVWITEESQYGLVFEDSSQSDYTTVFIAEQKVDYLRKRLKLAFTAQELYPEGYDLEQLFESFEVRKQRKDLDRGSKKAHKQLDKERSNRYK